MNIKTRSVELRTSSQTTSTSALQKGEDFVKAFTLGFDVDDAIARALRERAAANGRSVEAEHRMILREVLRPTDAATDFAAAAARMRARLRRGTDSESLVREGRDSR